MRAVKSHAAKPFRSSNMSDCRFNETVIAPAAVITVRTA
jgi:hypothetical protein